MERATCAHGGCGKLGSTCLLACLSPCRFNSTAVKHFCYDRDSCGGAPQQWEIERFRDALQKCMQVGVWGARLVRERWARGGVAGQYGVMVLRMQRFAIALKMRPLKAHATWHLRAGRLALALPAAGHFQGARPVRQPAH